MAFAFTPALSALDLPSVDGTIFDVLCDSAAILDEAEADAVDNALEEPMTKATAVTRHHWPGTITATLKLGLTL